MTSDMQMIPFDLTKMTSMEVKANTKAGLHLNIEKLTIMTTEEIHNLDIDNEDTEIVNDFLGSVISSDGDFSQEIQGS